jgi:uncharacterized protein
MIRRFRHLVFVMLLFLAACVTVNIYFPAAAMQKAADEIVDDVEGGKQEQKGDKTKDIKGWLLDQLRNARLGPREACAQVDVQVSTPAIRGIREAMKDTFQQLKPFKERGVVGENNKGFVEIRDASGLNLKEKADATRLVEQMNKNRAALYSEIVKANKLDPSAVSQVEKIFANSWRTKARSGWWIRNDQGVWEQKK